MNFDDGILIGYSDYYNKLANIQDECEIILYGPYYPDEDGRIFIEDIKNCLIERGYKKVFLVRDLSDEKLDILKVMDNDLFPPINFSDINIKNLIRSIASFYVGDIHIFVFPKVTTKYISGVVVEYVIFLILSASGYVESYSLENSVVIVDSYIEERKLSSLFKGISRLYNIKLRDYSQFEEACDHIEQHIIKKCNIF